MSHAQRSLVSVVESSESLRNGSSEIAYASEQFARRTESNAASLEETSAALAQIDGRIKATAEAASRTVMRADEAITTVSLNIEAASASLNSAVELWQVNGTKGQAC